jgi:enamine deaminase RidA (YjgF/YER057c/UK114 family)
MKLKRIGAGNRMSSAVIHGNKVYLAGYVAEAAAGKSVKEQTADILGQIDETLKEAGTDKTKIIKANIWLTDISTFAEMNEAWDAWVVPGQTPARATVESKLAAPGLDVEIMVEAAIEREGRAVHGAAARKAVIPARRPGSEEGACQEHGPIARRQGCRHEGCQEGLAASSLARVLPAVPDVGALEIERAEGGQRKTLTGGA